MPYKTPSYDARPLPEPEEPVEPQRPRSALRWGLPVVAVVALICGIFVVFSDRKDDKPSPAPSASVTTVVASATPADTTAPAASPTKKQPATTIGDGTFEVGVDIVAGIYKTTVPSTSPHCYWERQKGLSGTMNEILANENLSPGTQGIVRILSTDRGFKSQGCGTWTKSG